MTVTNVMNTESDDIILVITLMTHLGSLGTEDRGDTALRAAARQK